MLLTRFATLKFIEVRQASVASNSITGAMKNYTLSFPLVHLQSAVRTYLLTERVGPSTLSMASKYHA